jgi:putative ABC transport system substrate-binding protein
LVSHNLTNKLLRRDMASIPTPACRAIRLAVRHVPAHPESCRDATCGLLSYGFNGPDIWRHAASYVDRILRGAKPAELPVQFPTKFETVINLKTAKSLGLTIPETLLATADEVIQ